MDRRTFFRRATRAPSPPAPRTRAAAPAGPAPAAPPVSTGLEPYTGPWTEAQAAHLIRRTHFGVSRADLVDALFYTAPAAVDRIVDRAVNRPLPDAPSWYSTVANGGGQNTEWTYQWQEAWFAEMRAGGLRERMALLWHDHFATESAVYYHAAFAYGYLTLLRQRGLGLFRPLLHGVGTLPAMLVYLNGEDNTVGNPNENYARELCELFTMGILGPDGSPNYSQQDVSELARALTGWTVNMSTLRGQFVAGRHDGGVKIIFGQSGTWRYDDVVNLVFSRRAAQTAHFLAGKLYGWFVHPAPNAAVVDGLAAHLLATDFNIGSAVRLLLKSAHFFDTAFVGARLKDPLTILVGGLRELEVPTGPSVHAHFRELGFAMGQDVLNPPNVAGWPGYAPDQYRAWITTGTVPERQSYAASVILGGGPFARMDPFPLVQQTSDLTNAYAIARDLAKLLLPVPLAADEIEALENLLLDGAPFYEWNGVVTNDPEAARDRIRQLLLHLVNLPEYQLS